MQDWQFPTKNIDNVSNKLIANEDLLKQYIYILTLCYLEQKKPWFVKITNDDNEEQDLDAKKKLMVFDLEEKS